MPQSIKPLQTAISKFDRLSIAEHATEGERERQEIIKRFPVSSWPDLPLEKYALGLPDSEDSFCRWLEFRSPHLGSMRGGSAVKHIIYKHKQKSGWYFYPPEFKDEMDAWHAIRGDFVQALNLAQSNEWDKIDELPYLLGARALKTKTLKVYFPKEIIAVYSSTHIRHFLELLNRWKDEMAKWEAVKLNRFLLASLREIPDLRDWSTAELERFLYSWADPRASYKVVKIAPGENAKYWQECLDNGYICVGWDNVGDLRDFDGRESFTASFSEQYSALHKNHAPTITKKEKELWLLSELEPGDVIVANNGLSKILAVGQVVEPGYVWRPERAEFKHTVSVKWDTTFQQNIPPQKNWAFRTVDLVPASLYQQIISAKPGKDNGIYPIDEEFNRIEKALERKGQAIFYGPPGTGKTYVARRFAVWWLLNKQAPSRAQAVLVNQHALQMEEHKLSTSRRGQRVWWIVANPKDWTWDKLFTDKKVTFEYGRLQRNYSLAQPGDLVIGYQSQPVKKVVALAQITKGVEAASGKQPSLEIAPLVKLSTGISYDELTQDPILKESEPIRNRCQGTLFALSAEEAQYLLGLLAENQQDIQTYLTSGEGIGYLTWLTFHPSYSYEDFVEGFRPVETSSGLLLKMTDGIFKRICREALAHPDQKYLVIIDEINRANLAKVFGELITLLEKDKRGLTISLPQSKEIFTLPPNVYIIGTMNTADRSIKLLDVALRRRFAFFELMPNSELLQGTVINGLPLDAVLDTINGKISKMEGREKQIGHALFMAGGEPISELSEFGDRFRQDVLPLLQEYCYDDYSALEQYLGPKLVDMETKSLNMEIINDDTALIEALYDLVNNQDS